MDKKSYWKWGNDVTIKMLQAILSNTYVLFTKVRAFHVNYVWTDFVEKHTLLWEYKDMLYSEIDSLAEQIRKLCWTTQFSMWEFMSWSILKDIPWMQITIRNLSEILSDFEMLDSWISKAIDALGAPETCDYVTQSVLIDIRWCHDKIKWFLKSILW